MNHDQRLKKAEQHSLNHFDCLEDPDDLEDAQDLDDSQDSCLAVQLPSRSLLFQARLDGQHSMIKHRHIVGQHSVNISSAKQSGEWKCNHVQNHFSSGIHDRICHIKDASEIVTEHSIFTVRGAGGKPGRRTGH
jgi:hypothetical protein